MQAVAQPQGAGGRVSLSFLPFPPNFWTAESSPYCLPNLGVDFLERAKHGQEVGYDAVHACRVGSS